MLSARNTRNLVLVSLVRISLNNRNTECSNNFVNLLFPIYHEFKIPLVIIKVIRKNKNMCADITNKMQLIYMRLAKKYN